MSKGEPKYLPLNNQQKSFVNEYLIDFNPKAAALRAGYAESMAEKAYSFLLKHPAVKGEIKKRQTELEDIVDVKRIHVINEVAKLAFKDFEHFDGWSGTDKIKALELLAKILGIMEKNDARANLNQLNNIVIQIDKTDANL